MVVVILSSNMMSLGVFFWALRHLRSATFVAFVLLYPSNNPADPAPCFSVYEIYNWHTPPYVDGYGQTGDHYLQQKCYFLVYCVAGWWIISTWLPWHSLLVSASHHLWKGKVAEKQVNKPLMLPSRNCYSEHMWFYWITHLDWLLHFVP